MNIEEIKPCPFCGAKVKYHEDPTGVYWYVRHQQDCRFYESSKRNLDGLDFIMDLKELEQWNRRAT